MSDKKINRENLEVMTTPGGRFILPAAQRVHDVPPVHFLALRLFCYRPLSGGFRGQQRPRSTHRPLRSDPTRTAVAYLAASLRGPLLDTLNVLLGNSENPPVGNWRIESWKRHFATLASNQLKKENFIISLRHVGNVPAVPGPERRSPGVENDSRQGRSRETLDDSCSALRCARDVIDIPEKNQLQINKHAIHCRNTGCSVKKKGSHVARN